MLDEPTASRWGAQPGFVQGLRHWSWFREAVPGVLQRLARMPAAGRPADVDLAALGRAFWPWATTLEHTRQLEALDPVDYAHYQAGMLLAQLLRQRPLRAPGDERSDEVRAATGTALTLLSAWRQALGSAPLGPQLELGSPAAWASYVENVAEDPPIAVAFLDHFTGLEPVWRFPSLATERPAMRHALEQRRPPN